MIRPSDAHEPDEHRADAIITPATMLVVAVIVVGTAVRVLLAATIGLGVDESYAVAVARQWSLGYFDHPPLAFWIAGAVARLTGHENGFVMRLPFIVMFAGTTWLVYRIGARQFGEWAGAYAALLVNLAPVFSVSTGGWILPDGPLMFFLLLAVACLTRALLENGGPALSWWIAAGLAAGLALLSKYQAVLPIVGLLTFLLTQPAARRRLRTPGPYVGGALAALLFTPVIAWNARHGWASFRFQLARGASEPGLHLGALLENVGGQAGYLLPWIWLPLVAVLWRGLVRGPRDAKRWFFICLAIWPIGLFTLVALGGKPGLPHWPAAGYLMLFPLLGDVVASRMARGDARVRRWLAASAIAFAIILAIVATQTATGWMTRLVPGLFRRGDPTLEALDWTDLRTTLATRGLLRDSSLFVASTSWIEGGKIAYALGERVTVVCLCRNPHHFAYLHEQRALFGRDALLLDRTRGSSDAARRYAPYFATIDSLAPVVVRRGGYPALTIAVFRAHDFRVPYPMHTE